MRLINKLIPIAVVSIVLVVLASQVQAQVPVIPVASLPQLNTITPGINFENLFSYTPLQRDIVSHVLTLGYAAQAAGFVYFVTTSNNIASRYRLSSSLSAVVMVSAFLELFQL